MWLWDVIDPKVAAAALAAMPPVVGTQKHWSGLSDLERAEAVLRRVPCEVSAAAKAAWCVTAAKYCPDDDRMSASSFVTAATERVARDAALAHLVVLHAKEMEDDAASVQAMEPQPTGA